MSTKLDISQAERFVKVRAQLMLLIKFSGHNLDKHDQQWARDLYVKSDMISHPFAPGTERCKWYIDQIETFLGYARAAIDEEMAPWMVYADQEKRRALVRAGDQEPVRNQTSKTGRGHGKVNR